MGFLEDVGAAFDKGVRDTQAFISNTSDDIVRGASKSVAQLTGSGVNGNGRVVGPLADVFGSDPMEFALNATKHFNGFFRSTSNRVAERAGKANFSVDAPGGRGGKVKVPAKLTKKDKPARVALVTTLNALEHPAILLEEAGREQQGLPVKRGLDGPYTWYPTHLPARGFFGIDEAVAGAAALSILVALAPAIIGALISVVGAISGEAGKVVSDVLGGDEEELPVEEPGLFGIAGLDPMIAVIIGAAVLVGGYLVLSKRGSS